MATAVFKPMSRRAAVVGPDDSSRSSSNGGAHGRSRSLSRGPGRFSSAGLHDGAELPAPPRGRFVNTVRGSGFPEMSLDDLAADDFFTGRDFEEDLERERRGGRSSSSGRRLSDASFLMDTESSKRRGRSVSRKGGSFESGVGVNGRFDNDARRRRSLSVARNHCSDSEGESDLSCNSSAKNKLRTLQKGNCLPGTSPSTISSHGLRRSYSQKGSRLSPDSHSRYSSLLTDNETPKTITTGSGCEKTISTVYDGKKGENPVGDGDYGLYEVMRKEVRNAVDEIRAELKKVIIKTEPTDGNNFQPKGSEVVQAIAEIRRNYTTKLEESEKRRQKLLAELAAEEQHRQELTKIVNELLPGQKQTVPERSYRFGKWINDRRRMCKHLSEDAEKYFEDFISSVEDTDISSFDGERSDGSSTIVGSRKSSTVAEGKPCIQKSASSPPEVDGLILPWLTWETCNESDPMSCKNKALFAAHLQEASGVHNSIFSKISGGNWSPGDCDSFSATSKTEASSKAGEAGRSHTDGGIQGRYGPSPFNMDEYLHLKDREDRLLEAGLRQRQRIESGGLVLCMRNFMGH